MTVPKRSRNGTNYKNVSDGNVSVLTLVIDLKSSRPQVLPEVLSVMDSVTFEEDGGWWHC